MGAANLAPFTIITTNKCLALSAQHEMLYIYRESLYMKKKNIYNIIQEREREGESKGKSIEKIKEERWEWYRRKEILYCIIQKERERRQAEQICLYVEPIEPDESLSTMRGATPELVSYFGTRRESNEREKDIGNTHVL